MRYTGNPGDHRSPEPWYVGYAGPPLKEELGSAATFSDIATALAPDLAHGKVLAGGSLVVVPRCG
ncbi:hypothetical protein STVA_33780 [Allostella vacuolata]|nr:hypothetical protein STVA_33780 [Stella vacuolata]